MVQGTGLFVIVERAISLNRPLRTRTVGGVGAGGENPLATRLGVVSLIVSPHAQDANRFFFGKDLVDQAVLNIDATRVGASKITDQLFEGRWILKWVTGKNRQ